MGESRAMGVRIKFYKGAWWIFINHQGRRRAKKVGDRETAKRLGQQIREKLAGGDLQLPAGAAEETFETYARAWLRSLSGNLKASTIKFYGDNLE
jgi:integrase